MRCYACVLCLVAGIFLVSCQPALPPAPGAGESPTAPANETVAQIVPPYSIYDFAWSPDSANVIAVVESEAEGQALVIAGMDSPELRVLLGSPAIADRLRAHPRGLPAVTADMPTPQVEPAAGGPGGSYLSPAWSPTGTRIAVYFDPDEETRANLGLSEGIYTIDVNGHNLRQVIPLSHLEYALFCSGISWSPDEQHLYYLRRDAQEQRWLAILNTDGSGERLTAQIPEGGSMSTSPDGRWAVFEAGNGESQDLFVITTEGTGLLNLTGNGNDELEYSFSWSPDGTRLVYVAGSWPYGEHDIKLYVINADGTGKRLIDDTIHYGAVRWSPDGQWLLYTIPTADRGEVLVRRRVDF